MSVRYFSSLFKSTDPASVADFTDVAKQKLDALESKVNDKQTVANWDPRAATGTRHPTVSENQERALLAIEARDAPVQTKDVVSALKQFAETQLNFDPTKAAAAVAALQRKLGTIPITVTMPGSALFEKAVPKGEETEYKAATQQNRIKTEKD